MSISIVPRIQLFNYNGQSTYAPPPNTSEGFQIPANEFGSSYSVNTGSGANVDTSYSLGANGQIQTGNSMSLSQLMTFGAGAYGAGSTPESAATSISDNYQGYLNSLSISPQNFNSLMQQPSFTIFNGIVGEKVTTNGAGGIASVSIQPGSLAQEEGTSSNFSFPDQEEIASRAASVEGNDLFLTNPPPVTDQPNKNYQSSYMNAQKTAQPTPALQPVQPNNKLLMQALNMNPGMSTASNNQSNPLLQTLLQLQPKTVENPIFGMDSQLTPETAVNLAATNAAYGVQLSTQTQANLDSIRTGVAQAAQQITPQQVSQARDGMMPLNPFLRSGNSTTQGNFASEGGNNLKQLSTSVDTTDKKSSGGYIPFRMANQNSSNGSSQGQGQQRKPRPRLNAIA